MEIRSWTRLGYYILSKRDITVEIKDNEQLTPLFRKFVPKDAVSLFLSDVTKGFLSLSYVFAPASETPV